MVHLSCMIENFRKVLSGNQEFLEDRRNYLENYFKKLWNLFRNSDEIIQDISGKN